MVKKIKSRDRNKTSLKSIKKAMEEEEPEFTSAAVMRNEILSLKGVPEVKNVGKGEKLQEQNEHEEDSNDRVRITKVETASDVGFEATSPVVNTCTADYNLIGQQSSERNVCSKTPVKTRSGRSKDQKLTTTLFAVSIAYVILVTPDLIIHVMDVFTLLQDNKFQNFRTVTQTLYLINFVINPFIHLLVNSYYKEEVKRRYGCCLCFIK